MTTTIEWWVLIGVVVLLVVGSFVAGCAFSRRQPVSTDDLRYVRYNGEIYLSSADLVTSLRAVGHDDMADTMLGFARAAAIAADNTGKKTGP